MGWWRFRRPNLENVSWHLRKTTASVGQQLEANETEAGTNEFEAEFLNFTKELEEAGVGFGSLQRDDQLAAVCRLMRLALHRHAFGTNLGDARRPAGAWRRFLKSALAYVARAPLEGEEEDEAEAAGEEEDEAECAREK